MKLLVVSLILVSSVSAVASEAVYRSLNVSEVAISNGGINSKHQKSVGGITCVKEYNYSKGTKFSCEFDLNTVDSAKIYKALNSAEIPVAAIRTELRYKKVAGELSCLKVNRINNEQISCKLSTDSFVDREDPRE